MQSEQQLEVERPSWDVVLGYWLMGAGAVLGALGLGVAAFQALR